MKNLKSGLSFGLLCLALIWGVMLIGFLLPLNQFGIVPREVSVRGFMGIFLSPLIHENLGHIMANSIPLFVLTATLMASYQKLAIRVILFSILIGGGLVWIFGRGSAVHIGASGLIFSLIGFLIFNVFFRKDWKSLLIAIVIVFFYWTAIFGIFPSNPHISWEAHLFGFLTGIWLAFIFRKSPSNGSEFNKFIWSKLYWLTLFFNHIGISKISIPPLRGKNDVTPQERGWRLILSGFFYKKNIS